MPETGSEEQIPSGVVDLREDVPLKPSNTRSSSGSCGGDIGGLRFIIGSFAALSAAVTIALATQIYYGDYELVPHGSVATDSVVCSGIGTDILKAGGSAADAAIGAAFCLAVVSPHSTGLDAAGVILHYEYRRNRESGPSAVTFFRDEASESPGRPAIGPPTLVQGLAYIHSRYGKLPWQTLVMPSVNLARHSFLVSNQLSAASLGLGTDAPEPYGQLVAGHPLTLPYLANFLDFVANVSSKDLSSNISISLELGPASGGPSNGDWRIWSAPASFKLEAAFRGVIKAHNGPDMLRDKATSLLISLADEVEMKGSVGVLDTREGTASNVAIVDKDDVYVSLVTGMGDLFGSKHFNPQGYLLASPGAAVNTLTPFILTEKLICGRRFISGAGGIGRAAQLAAALVSRAGDGSPGQPGNLTAAVEQPRFTVHPRQPPLIGIEVDREPSFSVVELDALSRAGNLYNLRGPYPSSNVVEKIGDILASHSDSRGGGIASRF